MPNTLTILSSFTEKALIIDTNTRRITVPPGFFLGVYNDKDVFSVPFEVDRYYDEDVDLSEFSIRINYLNAAGEGNVYNVIDPVVTEDKITFKWTLGRGVFAKDGSVKFIVCMQKLDENEAIEREFNTTVTTAQVLPGLEVDSTDDPAVYSILVSMQALEASASSAAETAETIQNEIEDYVEDIEATLRNYISQPRVAAQASDMANEEYIYVYVGDETGYTYGDWYYYDVSNEVWTSGGVYNAATVETDDTLTVSGMPADARSAGLIARGAQETASNAENEAAEAASKVTALESRVDEIALKLQTKIDDAYLEDGYQYMTSDGVIVVGPLGPFAGGGGGGGGGNNAVLTVENTSGWLSKTISEGSPCPISFTWSSIEDEMPTGNGVVRITVNSVFKSSIEIEQGSVSIDLAPYLSTGSNVVKVQVYDVYSNGRTINFSITQIALKITSTFDAFTTYSGPIQFSYVPIGSVAKTVHFIVDGTEIGTQQTSVSGRQVSYTIPAQLHGSHSIRVYFEAVINEETVTSNELYYEVICVESGNTDVIIASPFNITTVSQYTSVVVPFTVYDPTSLTADIVIKIDGTAVSTQTVDRTQHNYTVRPDTPGSLVIKIECGNVYKQFMVTVTESQIDVEPETENLALYLDAQGRSNNEEHPDSWIFGEGTSQVSCTFTGFNFVSDGWLTDSDGAVRLKVSGDARLTIPYQPFATDFRGTGKTIELEFSTENVLDYDSTILSCLSGGRGIAVTAQKAYLKSEQSEISTQYKEDEHVRIAFVAEKRSENRLLYIYINGIMSGVVQYPVDDDFSQMEPVDISVGSSDCTINLYCIRVYDNDLTRFQIVDNWIADTQDGATMLDRYLRNNIFDAYGNIVISKLPSDLPYMIRTAEELPQYKGDKKTVSISFTNPAVPAKSYTATEVQSDVQGTSSQYYPRKNYKDKYKEGFVMPNGSTASKYAMNADAIPTKTFTMKADVASSEGANNVELARLYNDACPYKTPAQQENDKIRQGIDGFPIVMFWNDGNNTTFLGKYNFNNDKGTEEVFGFEEPDESWEVKNNTSDRVIWKSDDYTGSDWLNDFEARYPDTDPPYEDPSQLAEFAAWVKSTDMTAATGDALPESVTYGGVTYTSDSAEYRLAKFKAEADNYMEMQSALFYYLFTELFLMVDSRAKNAFPSFIGSEVVGS